MFSPFSDSVYAKTHWNVFVVYKGWEVVPNAVEFAKNTQALRVVKSVCKSSSLGNCRRGPVELANMDELCEPLAKRRRISGKHCMCI